MTTGTPRKATPVRQRPRVGLPGQAPENPTAHAENAQKRFDIPRHRNVENAQRPVLQEVIDADQTIRANGKAPVARSRSQDQRACLVGVASWPPVCHANWERCPDGAVSRGGFFRAPPPCSILCQRLPMEPRALGTSGSGCDVQELRHRAGTRPPSDPTCD